MTATSRSQADDIETNGSSLTLQAFAQLRDSIIFGELAPAQRLKVEVLRETLGMGASPIREALSLLTSEGLVERLDKRGFRVSDVSIEQYRDLHSSRCFLESHVLAQSIQHGDAAWEDRIVLASHRLNRVPRLAPGSKHPNSEWDRFHKAYHMALLSACPSATLVQFCSNLHDHVNRHRNMAAAAVAENRDSKEEHNRIADACIERDVELAVKLLIDHYERTTGILEGVLFARRPG